MFWFSLGAQVSLFFIFLILLATWFLKTRKHSSIHADDEYALYVISVIKALKKVCPVGSINKWKLLDSGFGSPRCWKQDFEMAFGSNLKLNNAIFGSSVIIKGSSLEIMRIISNTIYWPEWKPMVTSDSYRSKSFDEPHLREDNYMRSSKIISEADDLVFFRFSNLSPDNLGWMLLWNAKQLDWSFFLVQPSFNKEFEYCMLTYILFNPLLKDDSSVRLLISTVNAIRDAVEINSVHLICSSFTTEDNKIQDKQTKEFYRKFAKQSSTFHRSKHKRNDKVFKLLPHVNGGEATISSLKNFSLCIDVKKKEKIKVPEYSENISSNCSQDDDLYAHSSSLSNSASQTMSADMQKHMKTAASYSKSEQNLNSKNEVSKQSMADSSRLPTSMQYTRIKNKCNISKKRSKTVSLLTEENKSLKNVNYRCKSDADLYSRKLSSVMVSDKLKECESNSTCSEENSYINEVCSPFQVNNTLVTSEEDISHATQLDYEILLPNIDKSAHRLADIITNGNYGTSELQAEIFDASHVDIQSAPIEDQLFPTRTWFFHSTYRNITVLSKISSSGHFNILSFACKTEVNLKTVDVWKVVKNPYTRFICDETVKKVKVLEQISDDQKIIHTYHEINHLLKKEEIDFCLLHTERVEQSKYYLAIQSIEYANCPLMDSVTRGMLLPCGWLLQPSNDDNECTLINFLFRVLVNNPSSLFIQELSQFVPLYLYNLKKYLSQPF